MNIKFQEATTDDIPVISALAKDIWRKYYLTIITSEQIEYMLENMYSSEKLLQQINDGHIFTIVYNDNKPVGYTSISTKDGKNYFIHKFYIYTNGHRKGIGSELFDYVLKKMNTPETIELTVNRKNYKAVNFYFKQGFVIKGVGDFNIGNGFFMEDFVMMKNNSEK